MDIPRVALVLFILGRCHFAAKFFQDGLFFQVNRFQICLQIDDIELVSRNRYSLLFGKMRHIIHRLVESNLQARSIANNLLARVATLGSTAVVKQLLAAGDKTDHLSHSKNTADARCG